MPSRSRTRFPGFVFNTSAAIFLNCAMASWQASSTALPMVVVERLAPVDRSKGVMAVSQLTTLTRSMATPISSAAICCITVWLPWPISVLPMTTEIEPSP